MPRYHSGVASAGASLSARRAWIEIALTINGEPLVSASLSARRAWIEIAVMEPLPPFPAVALRKESVDRNKQKAKYDRDGNMSLSARRAWIEIKKTLS